MTRVAREHWIDDEDILLFFKKYISKTPEEVRELLDDDVFIAGLVIGLAYARTQHTDVPASKGDNAILKRILEAVITATRHTPHIGVN